MTAVVCARARARSEATPASSWRPCSIAKSGRATAVERHADRQRADDQRRVEQRAAAAARRRSMRSGSGASSASGSASATATMRLIHRICTGSHRQAGRIAVAQREGEHGDGDQERLPDARRQHEAQRLDEVVVDAAALLDRGAKGREVVVGQHHVGGLLARPRSRRGPSPRRCRPGAAPARR